VLGSVALGNEPGTLRAARENIAKEGTDSTRTAPGGRVDQRRRFRNRQSGSGKESIGQKPLTEMSAADRYKGQDGGLYGGGKNEPPAEHRRAAMAALEKIE